jgi:hypothetical protein
MEAEDMPLTAQKRVEIHHQTFTPRTQADVPELLASLLPIAKAECVTGRIVLQLNNGGVRNVQVERIEENDVP